jgi:hypothetical protein
MQCKKVKCVLCLKSGSIITFEDGPDPSWVWTKRRHFQLTVSKAMHKTSQRRHRETKQAQTKMQVSRLSCRTQRSAQVKMLHCSIHKTQENGDTTLQAASLSVSICSRKWKRLQE